MLESIIHTVYVLHRQGRPFSCGKCLRQSTQPVIEQTMPLISLDVTKQFIADYFWRSSSQGCLMIIQMAKERFLRSVRLELHVYIDILPAWLSNQ